MERMQDNICALSVAVGRQLYDAELQTAGSHTVALVRRALTEFPIDQPVTIRIHPTDLASITASAVAEGTPLTVGRAEAQWIPDLRVAPGGCVVEGRDRIIDGRVDTALERLYRRLLKCPPHIRRVAIRKIRALHHQQIRDAAHRIDPRLRAPGTAVAKRSGRHHRGHVGRVG